ncbi:hypothetical protein D3C83_46330 [compost metagenome]
MRNALRNGSVNVAAVSCVTPCRVQPRSPTISTTGTLSPRSQPRIESPDSMRPVFWIRMTGVFPPAARPEATAHASPSRGTAISRSEGSPFISR